MKYAVILCILAWSTLYPADDTIIVIEPSINPQITAASILKKMIHNMIGMYLPINVYEVQSCKGSFNSSFEKICPLGSLDDCSLNTLIAIAQKKYFLARPLFIDKSGKPSGESWFPLNRDQFDLTLSIVINAENRHEGIFNLLPQPRIAGCMTCPRYRPNHLIAYQEEYISEEDEETLTRIIQAHEQEISTR